MRQKWPVLAAVVPVVFGWALIAAYATPGVANATGVLSAPDVFGASGASGVSGVSGPGGWVQPGGAVSPLAQGSAGGKPRTAGGRTQAKQAVVTSSNWAGYADTGPDDDFTNVTSSWVQPPGHCSSGDRYAAFWVGLDGYSSRTVEQIGSEADCVGQTARYSAWYEIYPSPEVAFSNTVQAGDQLSASVSYEGGSKFLLTITDSTQHWKRSATRRLAGAARSSAEIIAEAPCCTRWHLAADQLRHGQLWCHDGEQRKPVHARAGGDHDAGHVCLGAVQLPELHRQLHRVRRRLPLPAHPGQRRRLLTVP